MHSKLPFKVTGHRQRAVLAGLAILGGVTLLAGCQRPGPAAGADATGSLPPMRVTAGKPGRKTLIRVVELPGRAEAYEVTPLHAKVTGYVEKIAVDIGDRIQGPRGDAPGSVLCEILVPELREELTEKTAKVAQLKSEVVQAEAGVRVAEAVVRSAEARVREAEATAAREAALFARWQSEFQRITQLAAAGAVTQKVADETRSELDAADAGRQESAARIVSAQALQQESVAGLEKVRADVAAARSRLAVAEAEQRRVEALLDYAVIRAPFDGIVVERNVHTGHLVEVGGGGERPLLVVMRLDPIRVVVDVPEVDAVYVNKGSKVQLRIPSLPGEPLVGTVTRTGWSLNTTSRTLTAEIDIPNADGHWRPGLFVQAQITIAELPNAVSLPKTAIVTQDKQTFCFLVDAEGKVQRRPIAIGLQAGTEFEVRDGLTGDENVILVNAAAFREGQTVEIAQPAK